jgi:hypothetical protein
MHEPPVLKRLTCREGDTQFLAVYHFLVHSNYQSNNGNRNEDDLNQNIEDDLKYPFEDTRSFG